MIFRRKKHEDDVDQLSNNSGYGKKLRYVKLEERRVLNATFAFDLMSAELTLENFVDSGIGDNSVDISQLGDDFVFSLNDGIWSVDGSAAGLDFTLSNGDSILTINNGNSSLSSLLLNDNTGDKFDISFDQFDFHSGIVEITGTTGTFGSITETTGADSSVEIGTFTFLADSIDLSNGSHDFNTIVGFTSGDIQIADTDDLQVQLLQSFAGSISLESDSDIAVLAGGPGIQTLAGDVSLTTLSADADIFIANQISTIDGNVELISADKIEFAEDGSIDSFGAGNILLVANVSGGDDDGTIFLNEESFLNSGFGTVSISNVGVDVGDIHLSEVLSLNDSDSAVTVASSGNILDATASENQNIHAVFGGVQLQSTDNIGSSGSGDLDVDADRLAFDTDGSLFVSSVDYGIRIESLGLLTSSRATDGVLIISNGALFISSDISVGSTSEFITGRSPDINDDIVVDNSAVIQLTSSTSAAIIFDAADDILFSTGSIITSGNDSNEVILLADQEQFIDGDAGSITNYVAGLTETIVTNHLIIVSGDGIGDSVGVDAIEGQALRINVDTIAAENFGSNGINIAESNELAIVGIFNIGRSVQLTAGSHIVDGDPDAVNIEGQNVSITSIDGSIGSTTNDIFKGDFEPIDIVATGSLSVSATNGLVAVAPLVPGTPANFNADSLVFYSNDDLNASTITNSSTINVNNLALVADADNDGAGTLTISDAVTVTGDLRIEGHTIVAVDSMLNEVIGNLSAQRVLISTDTSTEFNTSVQQLDIEFNGLTDPIVGSDQTLVINNNSSLELIELDCKPINAGQFTGVIAVGNLVLNVDGNLTQSDTPIYVTGQTTISAVGNICLTDGDIDGDGSTNNDFNTLIVANAINAEILDANDLTVLSANVTDKLWFAAGDADVAPNDGINGALELAGNIVVENQVLLQASEGVNQSGGIIDTAQLLLGGNESIERGGIFELLSFNNVQELAVTLDANFSFMTTTGLTIIDANFDSQCDDPGSNPDSELIEGILNVDHDVTIFADGFLNIDSTIDSGNGTVRLIANGDVIQTNNGAIFAGAIGVRQQAVVFGSANDVDGNGRFDIRLDQLNEVGTAALDNSFDGGAIIINHFTDLIVGHITGQSINDGISFEATDGIATTYSGPVNSGPADVDDGDILINSGGKIEINESVLAGNGNADVRLTAQGDIAQSSRGVIVANELGVRQESIGDVHLCADNVVDVVAISNSQGNIEFFDIDGFQLGNVATQSIGGVSFAETAGIVGDDIFLISDGNLHIDFVIDAGTFGVYLIARGDITQSAGSTISAEFVGIRQEASAYVASEDTDNNGRYDILLTGDNDVSLAAAFNAFDSGMIAFGNSSDLVIGEVESRAYCDDVFAITSGITTTFSGVAIVGAGDIEDADVLLNVDGFLQISEEISAGMGNSDVRVTAVGDIFQSLTTSIVADELGIRQDSGNAGVVDLRGLNDVNVIAISNASAGLTIVNDVDDLATGNLSGQSIASLGFMETNGITTANGDLKLTVGNDLLIGNQINVGDGVVFLNVGANLSQSMTGAITADGLGLMVEGSGILLATNDIDELAAQTDGVFVFNDIDDLDIDTVIVAPETNFEMTVIGIDSNGSDVKVTSGDLSVNKSIDVGTANLFLQTDGNVNQLESGVILAGGLGTMVSGSTRLEFGNDVQTFASDNNGLTVFNNISDLEIGTVVVAAESEFEMSVSGILTSDDVKLVVNGNLRIDSPINAGSAGVFLDVTGDVSQSPAGVITANRLGLMVDGTTLLASDNDVDLFAADNGGMIVYNDIDDLTIGVVTVAFETGFEMSVAGITTTNDDTKLISGNLFIVEQINTGAANVFLNVNGDVDQSENGTISAAGLGLMVSGSTRLEFGNDVQTFASDNIGLTVFNNISDLEIGTVVVAAESEFEMSVSGILTSDDVKLVVNGNLQIDGPINAGSAGVFLDVAGDVSQSPAGVITANRLGLMVDGTTLLASDNEVDLFAADNGGMIVYNDVDDLTIGVVTVAFETDFEMSVAGITTTNDDTKLTSGNLFIAEQINTGLANVFLNVIGDVDQSENGTISAAGLGLMVSGSTVLDANNMVSVFAAENGGPTLFNVLDDLSIGIVTVAAETEFSMSVTGVLTNDDLKLIVQDNLIVDKAANTGDGNTFLSVGGNLSQSVSGIIDSFGLGLMVSGSSTLDSDNVVQLFSAENNGVTVINVVGDVSVKTVTVFAGSAIEMSVSGITTTNDDVKLTIDGNLNIEQSVHAGNGSVFLDVNGNISQSENGTIESAGLAAVSSGSINLNAGNIVDVFAAWGSSDVLFHDEIDLAIGTVEVASESIFEMELSGVISSMGDIKLDVAGNLSIQQAIDSGNTVFLSAGGDLNQTAEGIIAAADLATMVEGSTVLDANNDADVFAANNMGTTLFNDVDELEIGSVTVFAGSAFEMSAIGIQSIDNDVKLTVSGDLNVNQNISSGAGNTFLVVGQNLTQSGSGTIEASGLGLMVNETTTLTANNQVDFFAASNAGLTVFNELNGFAVSSVIVNPNSELEMMATGVLTTNDDVKLTTNGDLVIQNRIEVGNANVFLVVTENLTQSSTGSITANGLGLMVSGISILESDNDVNDFAAENESLTVFNDIDDLIVSRVTVAAGSPFEMTVVGILINNDDVKLTANTDLLIDDAIDIGDGNALLSVTGNLSQSISDADGLDGTISGQGLAVMVEGTTELTNSANQVSDFSSDTGGNIAFTNSTDLTINSITVNSMTVDGLATDGNIELTIDGNLDQLSAVVIVGTTNINTTGSVCLTGADNNNDATNDNDFVGIVNVFANLQVEIVDTNGLLVGDVIAGDQIQLRSGDGQSGAISLFGVLTTTTAGGQVLLQSDSGISQASAVSVITTDNLLLGSTTIADARSGDFVLNGNNIVQNIAGRLDGGLEFTNRRSLQISPLTYESECNSFVDAFTGIDIESVVFNVTNGQMTQGNLTDAADAISVIQSTAALNVSGDITLGDGSATLQFTDHLIDNLLNQNVSGDYVTISQAGNGGGVDGADIVVTQNVSLFVDSSIILADVNVAGTLFIDTIEDPSENGSAGDILQTMISDQDTSLINAETAAFVSGASVQLTNTSFDRLAVEANQNHSLLIQPFQLNENIGSTFTGSIDANVFADGGLDPFLLSGDPANPVNGVFDADDEFRNDGFFAGNNEFVNSMRVGTIVVNDSSIELVSIESLGLSSVQLNDIANPMAAITSFGDVYVESAAGSDLDVSANIDVTSVFSNITIVAGDQLELNNGSEFRRLDFGNIIGLVNTLQGSFATDHFVLEDPRSVIDVPGNIAFSDLNAQLDSAIGYQFFDLFFGNPGEKSFNLLVGWFVDDVSASQAISATFQPTLIQGISDLSTEFLLSDFQNFGQSLSVFSIRINSVVEGFDQALTLTNNSQFEQAFFAERSFLLSQIFVTNDARINLFSDNGTADLNFTQEILPTRTVVQNPDPITVATPTFVIPESAGAAPLEIASFVSLIQDPESRPISTEQQPESFFQVKYTADDDGIYEQEFKWDDPNDDPDAIRAAIESAVLNDNESLWPDTSDEEESNWTENIKGGEVKPGLYFIFEVQEGQEIPEPVDAPVDRTDIENLVEPDSTDTTSFWYSELISPDASFDLHSIADSAVLVPFESVVLPVSNDADSDFRVIDLRSTRLSEATNNAMLGSSLLLAQCLINRKSKGQQETAEAECTDPNSALRNMFSRASRFLRKTKRIT